jgi:hypothetical protein
MYSLKERRLTMQPNTPFTSRTQAEAWRATQATDVDILAGRQPVPETAPAISRKLLRLTLWLLLFPILLVVFLMFGEFDKPGDVHPGTSAPPHVEPATNLPWQQ